MYKLVVKSKYMFAHVCIAVFVCLQGSLRIFYKEQIVRDLEGFQDYNLITAGSHGSNYDEN